MEFFLLSLTFYDLSTALYSTEAAPLTTQLVTNYQLHEGICNRGEGAYPCLLTEVPEACPERTHAVVYRAATCAPCDAEISDCSCAPDLYECQRFSKDCDLKE